MAIITISRPTLDLSQALRLLGWYLRTGIVLQRNLYTSLTKGTIDTFKGSGTTIIVNDIRKWYKRQICIVVSTPSVSSFCVTTLTSPPPLISLSISRSTNFRTKPTKQRDPLCRSSQVELLTFYDRHSGMNKILAVFARLVARTIPMICKTGK